MNLTGLLTIISEALQAQMTLHKQIHINNPSILIYDGKYIN